MLFMASLQRNTKVKWYTSLIVFFYMMLFSLQFFNAEQFPFFSRLLFSKTIQECDKLAGKSTALSRNIVKDAFFVVPIEKDGDVLQIEIHAETYLTSKKPIATVHTEITDDQLPDLFPLKYTISMPKRNIYQLRNIYREYDSFFRHVEVFSGI